ncbi:PAS domain S-box protein [Telluribacter sp.]|jgi:PAS domain S-box-containing protein|uniref:PAS domain S-box protein n=1 Tax=Telluribacter sp. TaxID=1978767 RepID=UPI002E0F3B4B|nr:PAS domain S-box protein [Telluribacter sp.]
MLTIPLRTSLIYLVAGTTWILVTDSAGYYAGGQEQEFYLNLIKGLLFVLLTSVLLYVLIDRSYRKLARSEKQHRALYENSPTPTWIYCLSDLRFLTVNEAAIQKYGYSREEFLAMQTTDIRPPEEVNRYLDFIAKMGDGHQYAAGVWKHKLKDGQEIYVTINTYPVDFDGEKAAMVIALDVTEKIVARQEAQRKTLELETLNEKLVEKRKRLSYVQNLAKVAGWEYYPEEDRLVGGEEILALFTDKKNGSPSYAQLIEAIVSEDLRRVLNANYQLLKTGKMIEVFYRVNWKGQIRHIRQVGEGDHLDGVPILRGMVQDVTHIKNMEQERDRVGNTLNRTLDSITDGVMELDHNWTIVRVNKSFENLLRVKADQVVGVNLWEVFPEAVSHRLYQEFLQVMATKNARSLEEYSPTRQQWFYITAIPAQDGIAVYLRDITERKVQEEQLRILLYRYETVAEATNEAIWDLDLLTNSLVWNRGIGRIFGYGSEHQETMLAWWEERVHPEDKDRATKSLFDAIENNSTYWCEQYRFRCADGKYKHVEDNGYISYNEAGKPVRMIGAMRDIDEVIKASEENKRLAEIITKVNNVIVISDEEGRINYVNPVFTEVTGYSFEEVKGKKPGAILQGPESDPQTIRLMSEALAARRFFSVEIINYTKAGQKYWLQIDCTPIYDNNGVHKGFIAIQNDVTERKEREVLLEKHVKVLQEISWLNSHEIRRPVSEIMGLMYLIQETTDPDEKTELYELVNEVAHNLDQVIREVAAKAYSLYNEKGLTKIKL